jgi:hypothetical protein
MASVVVRQALIERSGSGKKTFANVGGEAILYSISVKLLPTEDSGMLKNY